LRACKQDVLTKETTIFREERGTSSYGFLRLLSYKTYWSEKVNGGRLEEPLVIGRIILILTLNE